MTMAPSVRRKLRQMARTRVRSKEERIRNILDERTERLANRRGIAAEPAEALPRVLVCSAGRERFGIPIGSVAEVLPPQECAAVPAGPSALVGLFGRSGRLVSVIDLALALGLKPDSRDHDGQHFVLLRYVQPPVALRVDRAYAVADVTPLGDTETIGLSSDAVTGHGKVQTGTAAPDRDETVSLLDIERLLRSFLPSSSVSGV